MNVSSRVNEAQQIIRKRFLLKIVCLFLNKWGAARSQKRDVSSEDCLFEEEILQRQKKIIVKTTDIFQ